METPLRKIRIKKGYRITYVSKAVNCDHGYLSRAERGIYTPSPALAERLSSFYSGEVTELEILYPGRYETAFLPPVTKENSSH